ncbi:MAG: sugar transferase [Tenuifilaceae bacterium]
MIRLFDVVLSFIGLILVLPIFLLIALMIKIESKGSIFYKQERIGKNGIPFKLFKFRSMYVDSDKKGLITIGSKDSRITKVGYFLRNYKIDELPQLINVLIGDMSMVGPRPEVMKYVDLYTEVQKIVLSIKPGLTDYASIQFSNENELLAYSKDPEKTYIEEILPQKITLNMIFIKKQGLRQYFKIIFLTLVKIITLKKNG